MTGQTTTETISSTRGVELALHHFGGDGPPLLINHATGFHARCYLPMMPVLTQHFDVWGADFAGHGASTLPADGGFDWIGFAEDVLAVVDHLGAANIRAFGHSMGGAATLLAEVARPGLVEAAFLYEPIIFPPEVLAGGTRNSIMADGAAKRRPEFESKPEALARYASRPPLGLMRADALAAYVEHGFVETDTGTVTLACAPESEAATFHGAGTPIDTVSGVTSRLRIACGTAVEEPSPAAFAVPLAEALPNGELIKYDWLGHFGPLQDPTRLAVDVVSFLGGQ